MSHSSLSQSPDTRPAEAEAGVTRRRYRTTDVDRGTEVLRTRYTEHTPRFSGPRDGFELQLDSDTLSTPAGALSIDHVRHSMRTSVVAEPPPRLTVVTTMSGRARFTCGREEAASTVLAPTRSRYQVDWDDLETVTVVIDFPGVRAVAAEIAPIDPAALEFTAMSPISPDHARYFGSVVDHLHRELLGNTTLLANPLLRRETFRQLATALLTTFPNTTQTVDPGRGPGDTQPATVRRAIEFMDANAQRDIDITQIAAAARIGPRGLQTAFRRHRDETPLTYLRRVRMVGAHHDLQTADPTYGDTVATVAARWGFTHPGRFSIEYRRTYGYSPSDTLRR